MLSHPSNSESESEEVIAANATSELHQPEENLQRQATVEELLGQFLGQFDREYFRQWFVEGPRLLLTGCFSPRAAGFMIAAATPAILTVLFLTIPGLLFQTPAHNQFFYFAKIIESEGTLSLPVLLGTISSIFSLRFPLG